MTGEEERGRRSEIRDKKAAGRQKKEIGGQRLEVKDQRAHCGLWNRSHEPKNKIALIASHLKSSGWQEGTIYHLFGDTTVQRK